MLLRKLDWANHIPQDNSPSPVRLPTDLKNQKTGSPGPTPEQIFDLQKSAAELLWHEAKHNHLLMAADQKAVKGTITGLI